MTRFLAALSLIVFIPATGYAPPPPPDSGPCPQNPAQQPVQWAAFANGTITYGQWIALNPGFGTKVWACDDPNRPSDCARPATSLNGFCGCLGWLNPYEACRIYNP